MTLDSSLLWEKYESEFSIEFRERIDPNGAISDHRVNPSRRSSYGIYDYRSVLASHLKRVGIAVMLHADSEESGREFYGRVFTTIDDLLPQFTEDDAQEATEYEKKQDTYMSNQAFHSRAEKTLEILKEKKFYKGLDRVYAVLEMLRFLTIDVKRDEEPLSRYLQVGRTEDAKDYLKQQIGSCKGRIAASASETFKRYNLPAIGTDNALLAVDTELFEFVIGVLSDSYGLGFGHDIMSGVGNDIRELERYVSLSDHFDDGLEKAYSLLGGIPPQAIRERMIY